jgi:hypothetical protein
MRVSNVLLAPASSVFEVIALALLALSAFLMFISASEAENNAALQNKQTLISNTRKQIDELEKTLTDVQGASRRDLEPLRKAKAVLTIYERTQAITPRCYSAGLTYSEKTRAWFLSVDWIDDGDQIPRIVAFDADGHVVGVFESRAYPKDEIPSNVLVRSRLLYVKKNGTPTPRRLADMLQFNVSVDPKRITGIAFYNEGRPSYTPVRLIADGE